MAAGIRQRHGNACRNKTRCSCPFEASVYSKRDGKKIRKAFPTKAAAVPWRRDSLSAVAKQTMCAPTAETVGEAFEAWLLGAREGVIRNRSGDAYKPSAIRSYDEAMKLRVLPSLGSERVTEVTRNDLQDLADTLLAEGRSASTVGVAILPLRAIYRRALIRGEITVNPTGGLELPAVRGGRDKIAACGVREATGGAAGGRPRLVGHGDVRRA